MEEDEFSKDHLDLRNFILQATLLKKIQRLETTLHNAIRNKLLGENGGKMFSQVDDITNEDHSYHHLRL